MKGKIIPRQLTPQQWDYILRPVFERGNEGTKTWPDGNFKINTALLPKPVFDDFKKHPPKQSSFPYEDAIREVVKEVTKWLLTQISKTIKNLINRLKRRRRFRRKMKNK